MKRGFVVLLAVAFLCGCAAKDTGESTTTTLPMMAAEVGDMVQVSYTGMLEDGKVFDSSYAEVAKVAGIYDPARTYEPLSFTLGDNEVIVGFEDAVVGMAVGDNKTVEIPPEQAYGKWDSALVERMNRTQTSPRIEEVSLKAFEENLGTTPTEGMVYYSPSYKWDMTVVGVNGSVVEIRHDPANGTVISTPFGPAEVSAGEDDLIIRINQVEGSFVATPVGRARIMSVTDGVILLDFNHYLAGKALTFSIVVENITKGT